ncbi:hypothetical protein D9M69_578450 [compost metagenome]
MSLSRSSCGCRRSITWLAVRSRSACGLRLISRRPLLSVALSPSMPMYDDRLATAGSLRMIPASSCWRWLMAANDTDCGASEMPWIRPVSCTGKKPLGTAR